MHLTFSKKQSRRSPGLGWITRGSNHHHGLICSLVALALIVLAKNHGAHGFPATWLASYERSRNPANHFIFRKNSVRSSEPNALSSQPAMTKLHMSTIENDADPLASLEQLNNLVPRAKITPLVKSKSNLQGTLQTAWHFGLVAASAIFLPPRLAMLAVAFVSSFFFTGLHECVHRTAFKSVQLNDVVAHVFGFLCLRPAIHYRYYHWQHHKYTGDVDLDSELQAGSFLDLPVNSIPSYLFYLSGIPFWIDAVTTTLQHARGKCPEMYLHDDKKACHQVTFEARIYVALYAAMAGLASVVPRVGSALRHYWIWPALLGQPFLRFYLLAEHRGRATSPVIYENTRTMQTNALYRKLAWNMPLHAAHHAWPAVPFHKLDAAHQLLVEAAATRSTTDDPSNLLEQGEEIGGGGQYGYLRFHASFLRHLMRRQQSKSNK